MKPGLLFLALTLLTSAPLSAAARAAVLLRADVVRATGDQVTAVGAATAILKGVDEELRVEADQITFNSEQNNLVCVGSVKISIKGRQITATEVSIDLGEQPARVFSLDGSGSVETKSGITFFRNLNPIPTKLLPSSN